MINSVKNPLQGGGGENDSLQPQKKMFMMMDRPI